MNRFRFSLESVLQVKYRHEELALARLSESQGRLIDAQSALARILKEKQAHIQLVRSVQSGRLNVTQLIAAQQYLDALNDRIEQLECLIMQIEEELEQRRQVVLEARRERKTLEAIREKQWRRYLRELEREEQNFADEIAGIRYGRAGGDQV